MLKLSRQVEYGLMAVQHIAHKPQGGVATAREIATAHNIPYEFVAKVLQKLCRAGIAVSQQGVNGGYALARRAEEIPVIDVIRAIENSGLVLMPCAETASTDVNGTKGISTTCEFERLCEIKNPLMKIQTRLVNMFTSMNIAEIL